MATIDNIAKLKQSTQPRSGAPDANVYFNPDGTFELITVEDGVTTLVLQLFNSGAIDIAANVAGTFIRAVGSFIDDGFEVGQTFTGSAFTSGGNNAQFKILTITQTTNPGDTITVVDATGMVTDAGTGDEVLTYDFEPNAITDEDGVTARACYAFERQERGDDENLRELDAFWDGNFKDAKAYALINGRTMSTTGTVDDVKKVRGGFSWKDATGKVVRVEHGVASLGDITPAAVPYVQNTQFGATTVLTFPGDIDESIKVYALAYGADITLTATGNIISSGATGKLDVLEIGDTFTITGSGLSNNGVFTVATKTDADNITTTEVITADESGVVGLNLTVDYTADFYVSTRTWNQVHDRKSMVDSGYARVYGFGGAYGIGERPNPYNDTFAYADVWTVPISPFDVSDFISLDTADTIDGFVNIGGGTTADFDYKLTTTGMTLKQICAYCDALAMQDADVDSHVSNTWNGKEKDTLYTLDTDGKVVFMQGLYPTVVPVADRTNVILVDNSADSRTYQSVAGGVIVVGDAAAADPNCWFHMFYQDPPGASDEFNTLTAITVNDNSGTPIKGLVSGLTEISFDFAYSTNTQGGYAGDTDRPIVVEVEGDGGCTAKKYLGTITNSTSLSFPCEPSVETNI